ncbi:TonB-dependent siderophore receptor [Pandoraea apista]|uniref:TonB-dependent siderophore receptor n=1 Tax=Pandoraea apista TaxID=93218 RepID=A0ABX9ZHX0_9BURK|nr:TonB-dependent siderophore receptor [Pandoraea apista]RRJ27430.1 TonB-dependent siderophore receptor [Pandoraea apista]RRJ72935.1 TonB-dependent siderophore receptor [Pandoraea apista]RSD07208.1 TonB-dependent siderophore receptor [Pandoraea apista]RSD12157.1 TonB-dependent siderophore receptor [Pandoraea apista]RSK75329.1 TonB-dependent siderophore receptor [Pandoraea apista]
MEKSRTASSAALLAVQSTVACSMAAGYIGAATADDAVPLATTEVSAARYNAYVVESSSVATRTDTPIENIPQSIITVPRAMIEDQGSKTISDALRNVSNVNAIDSRDANNTVFNIRGFHSGTVVDGVAMKGNFTDQESLVNVDRIDVIKGPAGALFGAQGVGAYDTAGGTIAITTLEPTTLEAVRKIGFKAGAYGEKGLDFDINQPLNSAWAFRMTGEASNSDSETDRVFFRKRALFPSLSWTPNADTKVVLRARYLDTTTLDYSGLPVNGTLNTSIFTLPRQTNIAAAGLPNTTNTSKGLNLQWTQQLTEAWSFSLLSAYNEVRLDQRGTWLVDSASPMGCGDFGSATPFNNTMCGVRMWARLKTTTLSPSLTGKFTTGALKHTLNLGVDYEYTRDDEFMAYSNMLGPVSSDNVNLTNPVYPAWSEPVAPSTPDQQNRYISTVAYLQDQIDVGRWHFLGSVRYSDIRITDNNYAYGIYNVTSHSKVSPRVGAVYEITPKISAFAGYGEGIRVPAFYLFSSPPKPEEYTQKEIGLRLKDLGGITATVALFDLNRENVAVADPANAGYYIQAGKQRSRGIDADVRWQATPAWTWIVAYSQQTAKIVDDGNTALVDKQLFNVPKQTLRLATRYDIRTGALAGLGLGLGLTFNSALPGNSANTFFTPASTVWDAQASYTIGKARYGLNIFNLTNKKYFVPSNYFLGGQVIPALPRTVTVTAAFSF